MRTIHGLAAAAMAALATLPTPGRAQSGVTVFGIVDAAARSVSNEGQDSRRSLVSGAGNTSRLGFRGSEDLGDGLSAGFHLEQGVSLDTGTQASSTLLWDRRATISLVSRTLGEVRAGRDFVPTYTVWVRHDPFAYVGVAASSILLGTAPTGPATGLGSPPTLRAGNAIHYVLPGGLGGVEGGVMVAAGEGGKATDGYHKMVSGRLGYALGPWSVAAGFGQTENDLTTGGNRFRDSVLGTRYDFGVVRLSLAWRQFRFREARQSNLLFSGVVPIGLHELKWMFATTDLQGRVGVTDISANDARHFGVGYVYNLSRRTALYATAARINNESRASFAIPGGPTQVAGRSSTGFDAGFRHSF
jgi:predicted porin